MYHGRFKGTHFEAGYKYGKMLKEHGKKLDTCPTFELDYSRIEFAKKCIEKYKKYYPEIVEEVRGIAEGNEVDFYKLAALVFTMYCFNFDNKCTCLAVSDGENIIFGRNSDFLVDLEKLYMNVLYKLDGVYAFNGNTTAFVQMEDGINEYGLAIGLTFVPPTKSKPGFNAGIIVRYLLEKCRTVDDAINTLKSIPIASSQTITMADRLGKIVVVESNYENVEIIEPQKGENFIATANRFNSKNMQKYRMDQIDNWRAEERLQVAKNALIKEKENYNIRIIADILSGKYGFICQYDRKKNADTVWSVIYDVKNSKIYRVEGNPGRKNFKLDERMKMSK